MAMDERQRVAHLLRRAGFGSSPDELDAYVELGFDASVDRLLHPEEIDESDLDLPGVDESAQLDFRLIQTRWLYRMVHTQRPLVERMAYFWHGHFATSVEKVKSVKLMWDQVDMFRSLGLGRFDQLVLSVSQDPAMLVWLDNAKSKQEAPNENYGRELMELFTLGVGNYTEDDVKAAARAFTGWSIQLEANTYVGDEDVNDKELQSEEDTAAKKKADKAEKRNRDAVFAFRQRWHDNGEKIFLGQTGNWDGEDIVRIICEQPDCAEFIARKLFAFFVWDNPDADTVAPYAEVFSETNGDIREVVGAILRSPEFSSDQAYRAKVRSPIELLAGTYRAIGGGMLSNDLLRGTGRMGQTLFAPPNVGGWPTGLGWIGPSSVLERYNLLIDMMGARKGTELSDESTPVDIVKLVLASKPETSDDLIDAAVDLLLAGDIDSDQRDILAAYLDQIPNGGALSFDSEDNDFIGKVRGLIRLVTTMPSYQLI